MGGEVRELILQIVRAAVSHVIYGQSLVFLAVSGIATGGFEESVGLCPEDDQVDGLLLTLHFKECDGMRDVVNRNDVYLVLSLAVPP